MIVALIFTCHPARVCMWFTLKYFFSISVSMLLYLLHKAWRSSASFIQKKQKLFHLILVFPKQSRINRSNSNLGASFAQNHLMFVPKIYEWHLGFSLEFRIMHLHTGNLFDYLASDHRNGLLFLFPLIFLWRETDSSIFFSLVLTKRAYRTWYGLA